MDSWQDTRDARIHDYLIIMAVVILIHDHLITLSLEVERIWKHPRSLSSIGFLVTRYYSLCANGIVTMLNFAPFPPESRGCSCMKYIFARQIILVLSQIFVSLLLILRTYALYVRSKRILALLFGVGFSFLAITGWSVTGQGHSGSQVLIAGCHNGMSKETGIRVATPWEALLLYESMIFALTINATVNANSYNKGVRAIQQRMTLVNIVRRDGAIYYATMVSVNLSNILTFYLAPSLLKGALSTFSSNISVVLISRLMLNLHDADLRSRVGPTTTTTGTASSTTMLFTTNLGLEGPINLSTISYPTAPHENSRARRRDEEQVQRSGEYELELEDAGKWKKSPR